MMVSPSPTGRFIVLDGIDGSGKTTQLQHLAQWLRESGPAVQILSPETQVICTREPGATALGQRLRSLLLSAESPDLAPQPTAELLLYAADRAQHVSQVIRPQLQAGHWVLCDRHVDSTIAYQGYGRGLDLDTIEQLNHLATQGLTSDLTLWLDLPVAVAWQRRHQRLLNQGGSLDALDTMERADLAFHQRVRQGFADLAARFPDRLVSIDASQEPERVAQQIQGVILDRFGVAREMGI